MYDKIYRDYIITIIIIIIIITYYVVMGTGAVV
jgi:hypothetical protein